MEEERIETAIAGWRQELLELAGGSALWDIDSLGDAVIELTGAHPSGIAQLYAGRRTRLSNVVREGASLSQARRRARVVLARADELAAQFGVAPTYVAMGEARWFLADEPNKGRSGLDLHPPDGHIVQVPVVLRRIRVHRAAIPRPRPPAPANREPRLPPRPPLDAIEALAGALPDCDLDARIVVGASGRPGQALADDLDEHREALRTHHIVRGLAGDE